MNIPVHLNLDRDYPQSAFKENIKTLQNQFNVNLCDSNDETWYDEEIPVCHVTVIDEDEFFKRYFGENYDG